MLFGLIYILHFFIFFILIIGYILNIKKYIFGIYTVKIPKSENISNLNFIQILKHFSYK